MRVMDLTPRKREILRRVVEEYVATGQPVGSKALVERPGLDVSSSTVRSELSELEAIGLLMHPHTSAGRVPTESGYRVYTEELVGAIEGRPGPFQLDLTAMRNELEEALRRTTEALSDATHLLALVSAPALEAAAVRHVEVLELQPRVVIIVVITASGSVSKRVFELESRSTPGLVEWARARTSRRRSSAGGRAPSVVRAGVRGPGPLDAASGASSRRCGQRSPTSSPPRPTSTSAAPRACSATRAAPTLEACQRLLEVLERRAAVLGLLQEALDPDRTVVRVGPELEGEELRGASYVGTTYGLANRSLGAVGLLGPLRMDYEKAIRVGARRRVRALPARRRRLRRPLMATTEQDYYEPARRPARREPRRDQAGVSSARPRAPPGRQRRPEAGQRFRAVAEAYEVLVRPRAASGRTTGSATPVSAAAATRRWTPTSGASRTSSRPSSARRCSGSGGRPTPARRAGQTSSRTSRSTSRTP